MTDSMDNELKEEVFVWLDALRVSAQVNMFGASTYVEQEFGLDRRQAKDVTMEWMTTFEDRHPQG